MPPADRPYLSRPLAGVDQALAEGQAREPTELLDRLRERLDRLNPNHPSASPAEATADPVPETADPAEDAASPVAGAGDSREQSPSLPKEGTDRSGATKPVDREAGVPPSVGQAGEPVAAPSPRDQYGVVDSGVVDAGRAGAAERYRPWFAESWSADEPGAPWFIE